MKRWLAVTFAIIPLMALVLAAFMFRGWTLHRQSHVAPDALVGKPVPHLVLPPLEGGPPVDLAASVKGPALINLFAYWCAPCIVEHPHLLALQKKGVRIIGVTYKGDHPDDPAATAAYLTRLGDPYDLVLTDPERLAGVEFGISGVPETFLIDAHGKIVDKSSGPLDAKSAQVFYNKLQALR
jgi:cytochrome c biogenesis protein CcmG, thiol:disulfide interchange protein DsbE